MNIHILDSVEQLKGGASGAQIFKVLAADKHYVVRLLKNKSPQDSQREMTWLKIASEYGYGPTVYATDVDQGIIIMDFLQDEPMTLELRNSKKFYTALGTFLRTMHTGPSFPTTGYSVYHETDSIQKKLQALGQNRSTLDRLENIVHTIKTAADSFPHLAPCHNDLNPENLFYIHGKVYAIDFESAHQSDPYFDVATVSVYNCFTPEHENILLNTYFQRSMSIKEKSKFYLVKQLAFIFVALQYIRYQNLEQDVLDLEKIMHAQPLLDIISDIIHGELSVDAGHDKERIMFAQSIFKEVFGNSESQEFKNAVKYLAT